VRPGGCADPDRDEVTSTVMRLPCWPMRDGSAALAAGSTGLLSQSSTCCAGPVVRKCSRAGPGAYSQAYPRSCRLSTAWCWCASVLISFRTVA
jgi:hypothetical protein